MTVNRVRSTSDTDASMCVERPSGYTVKRGDTLAAIAKAFHVPLADVLKANPQIRNPDRIYPGDVVRLPAVEAKVAEPRRAPGSGMAGIGGLSPQTFLGAKGVNAPLSPQVESTVCIPPLPTDFPPGFEPVSAEHLREIMPAARDEDIATYLIPLNRAMARFGIHTPKRKAAFLAQVAVESGQLRYRCELASGEAYEGRAGLGNVCPGDGPRYKGRGLIQLTGRSNYRRAGASLGLDLENNPDLAALPDNSANIAASFFASRGLNELADAGNIREITKRVNGGENGLEARTEHFDRGLGVFV